MKCTMVLIMCHIVYYDSKNFTDDSVKVATQKSAGVFSNTHLYVFPCNVTCVYTCGCNSMYKNRDFLAMTTEIQFLKSSNWLPFLQLFIASFSFSVFITSVICRCYVLFGSSLLNLNFFPISQKFSQQKRYDDQSRIDALFDCLYVCQFWRYDEKLNTELWLKLKFKPLHAKKKLRYSELFSEKNRKDKTDTLPKYASNKTRIYIHPRFTLIISIEFTNRKYFWI